MRNKCTTGEVSEKLNIPIFPLGYYDKVSLFPNLKRENGIQKFSNEEGETLHIIKFLKASGLEIKKNKKIY